MTRILGVTPSPVLYITCQYSPDTRPLVTHPLPPVRSRHTPHRRPPTPPPHGPDCPTPQQVRPAARPSVSRLSRVLPPPVDRHPPMTAAALSVVACLSVVTCPSPTAVYLSFTVRPSAGCFVVVVFLPAVAHSLPGPPLPFRIGLLRPDRHGRPPPAPSPTPRSRHHHLSRLNVGRAHLSPAAPVVHRCCRTWPFPFCRPSLCFVPAPFPQYHSAVCRLWWCWSPAAPSSALAVAGLSLPKFFFPAVRETRSPEAVYQRSDERRT
jgi:hypothetical protein